MSDAEREVLKVLWDHGPLAVRDVVSRLAEAGPGMDAVHRDHAVAAAGEERLRRERQEPVCVCLSRVVSREDVMRSRMNDLAGELCDGEALPLVLAFAERHRFSSPGAGPISANDRRPRGEARKARPAMNTIFWWLAQNTITIAVLIPIVAVGLPSLPQSSGRPARALGRASCSSSSRRPSSRGRGRLQQVWPSLEPAAAASTRPGDRRRSVSRYTTIASTEPDGPGWTTSSR